MKSIFVCSGLLLMVHGATSTIPSYSLTIVEKCLNDVSVAVPEASKLSTLLLPFLLNLLNNINNLSNIVHSLTPALLPYFGCTLPLLNSALSDMFSILIMYVGTLVSLLNSGLLLSPGLFGIVATILKFILELLKETADPLRLWPRVIELLEKVLEFLV